MKFSELQEALTLIVTRKQELIRGLDTLSRQEKMVQTDIQRVLDNLSAIEKERADTLDDDVVSMALYKKQKTDRIFVTVALKQKQESLKQILNNILQMNEELIVRRKMEAEARRLMDEEFGKVVYLSERKK